MSLVPIPLPIGVSLIPWDEVPKTVDGKARSSHWPAVRGTWIHAHPFCAVCQSKTRLEVHHCKPFHLHPELELDPTNFITLCEPHHLLFGHLMNWSAYNPSVRTDAGLWLGKIKARLAA